MEEQGIVGDIEDPTKGLPNPDGEKDIITSDEGSMRGRMMFYVPFRIDIVKTESKPGANPLKWLQFLFTIVKNTDKSAAILTDFGKYD